MVLGIMADKFPMPAAPPPDGVSPTPGGIEDGEGDMTPHGEEYTEGSDDSTPSGGASSDEINDVAKSEKEAGDASERVAGADGKAKGKSASNKPREVRHKSLRPANHAQDAEIESTDYSTLNSDGTWRDNYDPSNGGAGAYDRDGSEAFSVLRSAFPGAGRTFSTNPNGEPSIERWISRQPEMFQRRHDTGGRKGDVILIIDGSGSMDGRWQGYGHSITAGLIRCYRAGMLSRLRIILTQKSKLLVNENPKIGWADGVMTHGGTEGLDAAYRYIEREGWVDNPSVTTLVITDGDITDDVPCLRRCHAAGIYPVGAYVGNHSSVERVKAYFDHFITRTTPSALLAEITRIL
jgi:Mg-chelatase subunit ChlD